MSIVSRFRNCSNVRVLRVQGEFGEICTYHENICKIVYIPYVLFFLERVHGCYQIVTAVHALGGRCGRLALSIKLLLSCLPVLQSLGGLDLYSPTSPVAIVLGINSVLPGVWKAKVRQGPCSCCFGCFLLASVLVVMLGFSVFSF